METTREMVDSFLFAVMISSRLGYVNRILKNINLHACNFSGIAYNVNKVLLYLQRARFIDTIRLCLHSNSPESDLINILQGSGLGSFVVANALRSAPSPTSAIYLVDTLKKIPHFAHSKHTLYSLAKILAKSGQTGKLKALVNAINSGKFVNVFPVSFMDRMGWYAVAGDLDEVNRVWEEWRSTLNNHHPCTESYNLVMKLSVDKGLDSEAVKVFCRMIDEGALPNCRTYTVMIEHLVKFGKLKSSLEVFRMLPLMRVKRTSKQYSTLVEAFTRIDDLKTVKSLLYELQSDAILPNRAIRLSLQGLKEVGSCNDMDKLIKEMIPDERIKCIASSTVTYDDTDDDEVVVGGYGNVQRDEAIEVKLKPWLDPAALASALQHWQPEEVSALEGANFIWTSRFVCKLIRNLKSPETAWLFFCWVAHQPGYVHDIYTITRMITKLARHGCVQLIDQLISKIKVEDLRLPFSTIRLVIDLYGFSRMGDAALNIFRDVKNICGPLPNISQLLLYSSLLRTLAKCDMNAEVSDILEEMILLGIFPDLQTYSGLMHHYALKGDIKMVQRLFGIVRQSDMQLDAYTYSSLICAYCKGERAALALRVFEDMRNCGLMTDAATKEMLVKSLWKAGKLREAASVEEIGEEVGNDNIRLACPWLLHTVSTTDITRVRDLYKSCFTVADN